MVHTDIFKHFKEISHIKDDAIDEWFGNGKNSIRVRLTNREELIFTFVSRTEWRLETVESFLNNW